MCLSIHKNQNIHSTVLVPGHLPGSLPTVSVTTSSSLNYSLLRVYSSWCLCAWVLLPSNTVVATLPDFFRHSHFWSSCSIPWMSLDLINPVVFHTEQQTSSCLAGNPNTVAHVVGKAFKEKSKDCRKRPWYPNILQLNRNEVCKRSRTALSFSLSLSLSLSEPAQMRIREHLNASKKQCNNNNK